MKILGHVRINIRLFFLLYGTLCCGHLYAQDTYSLPEGKVGTAYEFKFQSEGGLAPLKWQVLSGTLPDGLALDSAGILRGKPVTAKTEAFTFTIELSDSANPPQKFAQTFRLIVRPSPLRIVLNNPELKMILPQPSDIKSNVTTVTGSGQPASEQNGSKPTPKPTANPDSTSSSSAKPDKAEGGKADEEKPKKLGEVTGLVTLASSNESSFTTEETVKRNLFFNKYIKNLAVHARDKKGDLFATSFTDDKGKFAFNLETGKEYTLSTEADSFSMTRTVIPTEKPVEVELPLDDRPVSLLSRAIIGFSQAGAISAKSDQNYFFDMFISQSLPFTQKIDPDFGERWRIWGDVRVGSVPQRITTGIGAFSTGFAENVANLKVSEAVQVVEFLTGVEIRIKGGNKSLLPSFDRQTKQKFTISLVAGFGTTTPVDPKDTIEIFKVTPGVPGLPPQAEGKDFIAFVSSDRDRFYRQYYAGFRFATYFFNRSNIPMQRFPAMFDIQYGQNEYVTGGRLQGGVFKLDAYYPLPFDEVKFVNLFYTALIRPGRTQISEPLILQRAPEGTVVPSPNSVIVAAPQFKRDYYRVGVGIDFVAFVQTLKSLGKK